MKKSWLAATAVISLLCANTAVAQEEAVFKPASAWAADYGDEYCRLVRDFTDGKEQITLIVQRIQPGADSQLLIVGNALRTFRGATDLQWGFMPNGADRKSTYLRSTVGSGDQYLRIDGVTLAPLTPPAPGTPPGPPRYDRAAEKALAATLTGVRFTGGLTKPAQIETGRLDGPIEALQTCTDDLVQTWGLDAEKHRTLSVPAIPQFSPDGWLPAGTIPFSEFAKFAGGSNQVRLMLDAAGKPSSCHIISPTLSESLNGRICELLMEKASFVPAKAAGGEALASYWMGSPMFLGPPMGGRR